MKYELIHKEQSLEVDIFNDFTKVSLVCTYGFNKAFGIEAKEI